MTNTFVITDFGAAPDGKTDCTKAIQQALDAASEVEGKVIVPPGRYICGHLSVKGRGVRMEGSAAWSFRTDGGSVLLFNGEKTDCMLDVTGAFGFSLADICLNGRKLGNGVNGLQIKWERPGTVEEDSLTVDNCRIGEFTGDGMHMCNAWCFRVRHSMLHRNTGAGMYFVGWDAFISDNWFSANENWGIRSDGWAAAITSTGNRVEWNRKGGFLIPGGEGHTFTGNFFDRSFGPGLSLGNLLGVYDCTITGNILRRNGAYEENNPPENPLDSCQLCMTNCSSTTVTGNTCLIGQDDGQKGVFTPDYGFILRDCNGCVVTGNSLYRGANRRTMTVEACGDCIIEKNVETLSGK